MADRKQALQDLLEKVLAGSGIEYAAYRAAFPNPEDREHEPIKNMDRVRLAFIGYLDAAKALHEAVLPNAPVCIHDMSQDYLGEQGWVVKVNWPHMIWQPTFTAAGPFAHEGRSDNPARAWLIAIIKALIAQEGE